MGKGKESMQGDGAGTGEEGRDACRFKRRLLVFLSLSLSLDLEGVDGV